MVSVFLNNINATCSVCIVLRLCGFQGWPFAHRSTLGVLYPGEVCCSHCQRSLAASSSLCRVEASWPSFSNSHRCWHCLVGCSLFSSRLAHHVDEMGVVSDILRRWSQRNLPHLLTLTFFLPSSLSLRYWGAEVCHSWDWGLQLCMLTGCILL